MKRGNADGAICAASLQGFWDYIADSFNVFDAVIVALSWVEIIITLSGSDVSVR